MEKMHPICSNQLAFLSYELSNKQVSIWRLHIPLILMVLGTEETETRIFYSCTSVTLFFLLFFLDCKTVVFFPPN